MKNSSHIIGSRIGSRSLLAAAFVTLLATGAGGCALSVQADVPDVEVTQHGIAVPGIPTQAIALLNSNGEVATNLSFTQSLPDLNLPKDLTSTVKAVKVDLIAKDGIQDFSFVKSLRVTMTPKGSTTVTELINYEKADGATVGSTLSVDSLNPVNILDQWKADSATFNIAIDGNMPSGNWTFDMAVHFSGQVTYKY